MENTYRLEFCEAQQWMRLDKNSHKSNTNGFATICDHCSDLEFEILESYIESKEVDKITIHRIYKSLSEVKKLISTLAEHKLEIVRTHNKANL